MSESVIRAPSPVRFTGDAPCKFRVKFNVNVDDEPTASLKEDRDGPPPTAYLLGNQQGTILFSKATSDVAGALRG